MTKTDEIRARIVQIMGEPHGHNGRLHYDADHVDSALYNLLAENKRLREVLEQVDEEYMGWRGIADTGRVAVAFSVLKAAHDALQAADAAKEEI